MLSLCIELIGGGSQWHRDSMGLLWGCIRVSNEKKPSRQAMYPTETVQVGFPATLLTYVGPEADPDLSPPWDDHSVGSASLRQWR